MEVTTLQVEKRDAVGSNQVARLRENGRVPCVIYGGELGSVNLSLDEADLARELRKHHRVFRLEMDGKTQGVFLQDIQFDVLTDQPLHIDLRRIDLDKPIRVIVDLAYLGHPAGASRGGELIKDKDAIEVDSLPHAVPDTIEVAVKDMDLGDAIKFKDLPLPDGVTIPEGEEDTVICHMSAPKAGGDAEGDAEGGDEPAPEGDA